MESVNTQSITAMLALIGAVIAVSALLSGFVERSNFPQVAVFLLLGAVLGPAGMGVLNVGLDSPVLRVVGTLSLALVLFTDALSLDLPQVRKHTSLGLAILGPGTLITTGLIGVAAYFLLGLPATHAALLAAAMASTDPVLLRGLLRRPDLPGQARLALQLESGLGDVVLLPIVLIAIAMAVPSEHGVNFGKMALQLLVLGPGAGAVVAAVAIGTLEFIRRRVGIRRDYESIYSLGICLAAFSAAEALHGSGFLAAFAAGFMISALDVELCDCFKEYGETTAEMLLMFTFVLLGGTLIWSGLSLLSLTLVIFIVLALAARPLTMFVTLKPLKIHDRSRAIIAWFGPRGLSTLLLVLVPVFEGVPGSSRLFQYASVLVLFSVAIHGISIMFFGTRTPSPPTRPKGALKRHKDEELTIAAEEAVAIVQSDPNAKLLDVRSERSFLNSEVMLENSVRLNLDRPQTDAERLGIPKDAQLLLYCTCPSEQTSLRVARELRSGGWQHALAVVGGYDALIEAGLTTVPKVIEMPVQS